MSTYQGRVYRAPSGQWGFKYYIDDQEAGGGAGFDHGVFATDLIGRQGAFAVGADIGDHI